MSKPEIRIGTAGWSISRDLSEFFPGAGSHLERYATHFNCAEINSTFYRPPRVSTLARWAASTPEDFRFAVKMPRAITHEGALQPRGGEELKAFLVRAKVLAEKLGPLLVQLPPKRLFDVTVARSFFTLLRDLHPDGPVALEPRHVSWFTPDAEAELRKFAIARVIADPLPTPEAMEIASHGALSYRRLHGSPRVYYSSYSKEHLDELNRSLRRPSPASEQWVIFDNTASGAAIRNAFDLDLLARERPHAKRLTL